MIRRDVIHPVFKARNAHTLGLQLTTPSHPSHWSRAPVRFQLPAFYFFLLCFVFYSLDLFTSFYVCGCFCQHVCLVPKWVLDSLELELQMVVSCLVWMLGTKLGPLEEQPLLLTVQPSVQPFRFVLFEKAWFHIVQAVLELTMSLRISDPPASTS